MSFCHKCGNELPTGANYCNKCGTALINSGLKAEQRPTRTPQERSSMWYLAPILIGLIGGIIAYFIIRKDDPKKARNCMVIGFGLFIVYVIIIGTLGNYHW